jgi:hypothetical protein
VTAQEVTYDERDGHSNVAVPVSGWLSNDHPAADELCALIWWQ